MIASIILACLALQDGWTQAKFDARRSGNVADRDVADSLGLLAAIPTGDAILTSPVVADGKIYVVDASGRAACVDATTFRELWHYDSRGGAANCNNVSSPALAGKYLHFGTMAGSWIVLDAATGALVIEHRIGEPIFTSALAANGRVYFATLGSRVHALTPEGTLRWTWDYVKEELKFDGDRWSGESWLKFRNGPLRQGDQFFCSRDLAATDRHVLVPAGGALVWLEDLGDRAQARDVHSTNGPTYGLSIGEDGSAYRQWSYLDNVGQVERLMLGGTEAFAGPGDGMGPVAGTESAWSGPGLANLTSFSSVSLRGNEVFRTRPQDGWGLCRHRPKATDRLFGAAATAAPIVLKSSVVYGDLQGSLHVVPLAPGRPAWSFRTPFGKAITAPVAVADGRIHFGCDDGYLYVLGPGGRAAAPDKELDLSRIRSPRSAGTRDRFTSFGDFSNANASDDGLRFPLRMKWIHRFEGTTKHLPTFGGGRMYTHTAEGQIFAVEAETGRLLWRAYHPGAHLSYTSALYHRERLLVPQAGPASCRLRCLDAATGKLLWEAPFEGSPGWSRQSPPVVVGNVAVYSFATGLRTVGERGTWLFPHNQRMFPAEQHPIVRAYDLESGRTVWERDFHDVGSGGDESGLCLVGDRLAYSCFFGRSPERDGKPAAMGITTLLDPATGKEIWRTTDYSVRGGCTVSTRDGRLYLSGSSPSSGPDGCHVWCLDAKDGSLVWKSDPLLKVLNVVTVGSKVIYVHAQYLEGYVLDKATGKTLKVFNHPYKCTRFTLSEPYLLGPNLDLIDLSDPVNPRIVSTGPRLDPTQCVASVASGGRLFYTALAGGLQISEVFGAEAERVTPVWSGR
jgi:outer membrane protein assembly factor BamB